MRALEVAAIGALVSVTAFFGVGAWSVYDVHKRTAGVDVAVLSKQADLDLQELHRVILEVGLTAKDARKASDLELETLPALTASVQDLLDQSKSSLAAVGSTAAEVGSSVREISKGATAVLKTADTTVARLQPIEDDAAGAVTALHTTAEAATTAINGADLPAIASEVHKTAVNTTAATGSVAATTADVQQAVHAYLHPTLPQKIWHFVANTGVQAAKFFF